ncbi:MAG: glycoside hydrolase family 3 C-terminal domain-containing protein [Chloroflexi bacterium]|nr:glycoside hydrolase family 3 C-terminal domain-containing protein [Chloroflexota bacterium]
MNDKIESLIAQLTLEEKITLLAGADFWHTVAIKRLGIPAIRVTDGPIGARGTSMQSGVTSACFPCGTALASTWNPEIVQRVGEALAEETRAKGAHILLAPTVNIHRTPLAGRNFECYSEDPYLTARMAIAYITGLQSKGVGACIKHFVCNDSEFERMSMSSEVDERTLREIYLRPFELAIREAKPWSVMSSYNRINGVYASENAYTLLDILKGEWGFDGIVMSDWFGSYSPNVARGGLDLEMPGPARWMGDKVMAEFKQGNVSEDMLNDKVRRLLRTVERAGAFAHPELQPERAIDKPEHRAIARQAASEAIVLLKNERAVLPLDASRVKSIAVIGENAKWASIRGGGSVRVNPHYVVAPFDSIAQRAGDSVQVEYAMGCVTRKNTPLLDTSWLSNGLTLQYFGNRALAGEPVHTETTRNAEFVWIDDNLGFVKGADFSVRLTGAFTTPACGTFEFSLAGVGKSRLFINDTLLLNSWDRATVWETREGKPVKGDIALDSGKPYQLTVEYVPEPGPRWRNLRIGCAIKLPADSIAQAAALAAKSDVAIVFVGLTDEWESEGFDRADMELPGDQAGLIEQVAAANPRTIVVVNAGSPITMNWLDRVAGVVEAWYLGQETGNAITDVLFGDVNPSGKLPTTFPKRLQDNPAYINYPGENGKVAYGEGIFVGYRYYDAKDVTPLFPFGYGLSYTTFAYSNLRLSQTDLGAGEALLVSVDIQNTGARAGKEIVQLYVRDAQSRLVRPEKELKAFAKVALAPGEIKTVTLVVDENALAYYDPAIKRWVAEAGEFQVLVGSSSRAIHLTAKFNFQGAASQSRQCARLHAGLPLRTLMEDAQGRAILYKYFAAQLAHMHLDAVGGMTLEQIATHVPQSLPAQVLDVINENLATIQ